MFDRLLRESLSRLALPLARGLTKAGISANTLTLVGTAVVAGAALLIVVERLPLAGWILLAGIVFDILDGVVARASREDSDAERRGEKVGAFLDSTTDRLSDGLIFSALAWHFSTRSPLGLALTLSAGVLAFLTSYIRARAEGLGLACKVGIAARPERMTLIIAGLILGLIVHALGVLVALSLVTVIQRFAHVWSQARTTPG